MLMNIERTGRFIAELRRDKQFTQAQLADSIHVSDKAVSRWETGRGFPDIDNLEALSECLDVSIAELIKGERINAPVSGAELNDIASDGLSLTRSLIAKRKITSTLLGFVLGLIIIIIAVIHMMSPVYIKDPGNALTIEELSDGSIVAVLDENVSGYDIDRFRDQDSGRSLAFIGCYLTRWNQISEKSSDILVRIGNKNEIDEVYYYPADGGDVLIYGDKSATEDGGVVTLPRLVYNYWLIIGGFLSIAGIILYMICRKKYYAEKILNAVLLPVAFTVSIPLCLLGRFDEVYNASYYFTGILLMTVAVYLVLRIVILLKKRKCYL
jgi:transcriptional regulator with XRE-family HTH domain